LLAALVRGRFDWLRELKAIGQRGAEVKRLVQEAQARAALHG
jgi:hypothetical protein